jgi:hypothetical protein
MGGYEDSMIAPGTYFITFAGNGYTGVDDAQHYVLQRAGELCPRGFDILGTNAEVINTGTTYQASYGTVTARQHNKPQASATVRCRDAGASIPSVATPGTGPGECFTDWECHNGTVCDRDRHECASPH